MPVDWNRALERAAELKDQGYSDSQVSPVLDQEAAAADRAAQQYGHDSAAAALTTLQNVRGALNADAAPPGVELDADPIEGMIHAAWESGGSRGDDRFIEAGIERLFAAAQAGDPRVTTQGVVDDATKQRWMADASQRQVANPPALRPAAASVSPWTPSTAPAPRSARSTT
jgi:hypothetical protein